MIGWADRAGELQPPVADLFEAKKKQSRRKMDDAGPMDKYQWTSNRPRKHQENMMVV